MRSRKWKRICALNVNSACSLGAASFIFLHKIWLAFNINTDAKISPTFKCRRNLILFGLCCVRWLVDKDRQKWRVKFSARKRIIRPSCPTRRTCGDVLQHQLLKRESTFSAKKVHPRFLYKYAINDAAKEMCITCKVLLKQCNEQAFTENLSLTCICPPVSRKVTLP